MKIDFENAKIILNINLPTQIVIFMQDEHPHAIEVLP